MAPPAAPLCARLPEPRRSRAGGAGGQHACAVARALGIRTILVHRYASVLSAYGLFLADVAEEAQVRPRARPNPHLWCKRRSAEASAGLLTRGDARPARVGRGSAGVVRSRSLTRRAHGRKIINEYIFGRRAHLQEPAASSLEASNHAALAEALSRLNGAATAALRAQGFAEAQIETQAFLNLRYQGTDCAVMTPLTEQPEAAGASAAAVSAADVPAFRTRFVEGYRREFGFELQGREILVDDIRVRAVGRNQRTAPKPRDSREAPAPVARTPVFFEGGRQDTDVYQLAEVGPGWTVQGPAMLLDAISTILVEPGCSAEITAQVCSRPSPKHDILNQGARTARRAWP